MIPTVYPYDLFTARRNSIIEAYRNLTPQQRQNVLEELADLAVHDDPRTCEQIDMDQFTKEVNETRRTDYPY
jgi:hypothetical protein